jgi:hypothetical protein
VIAQGNIVTLPASPPHQEELLHYRVLDCQPFLQGLIVTTTHIVILPPKEQEHIPAIPDLEPTEQQPPAQDEKFYVSSFILPTYSSPTPLFRIGKSSSTLPPSLATPPSPLIPSRLQVALLARPLELHSHNANDVDIQYEIGVTLKSLRYFHIFSGALVFLFVFIRCYCVYFILFVDKFYSFIIYLFLLFILFNISLFFA